MGHYFLRWDESGLIRTTDISQIHVAMSSRGTLDLAALVNPGQLFVGDSILYVPTEVQLGLTRGGYATVDISNPDNLALLGASLPISEPLFIPGADIAVNGTDIGLLVGRTTIPLTLDFANRAELVDTSDPSDNNRLLTVFELPLDPDQLDAGIPAAVSIGSGAGFVAAQENRDSPSSIICRSIPLETRRPLPFPRPSTRMRPPEFKLSKAARYPSILMNLDDDVQIRDVEVLLNGTSIRRDVSFPWDTTVVLPILSEGSATATIEVRATDTGGNVSADSILVELLPDVTVPTLLATTPVKRCRTRPSRSGDCR